MFAVQLMACGLWQPLYHLSFTPQTIKGSLNPFRLRSQEWSLFLGTIISKEKKRTWREKPFSLTSKRWQKSRFESLIYCTLDRCCHCRSQSVLCHRLSTLLRKGPHEHRKHLLTEDLSMKAQLKGLHFLAVYFEHHVFLSPSLCSPMLVLHAQMLA